MIDKVVTNVFYPIMDIGEGNFRSLYWELKQCIRRFKSTNKDLKEFLKSEDEEKKKLKYGSKKLKRANKKRESCNTILLYFAKIMIDFFIDIFLKLQAYTSMIVEKIERDDKLDFDVDEVGGVDTKEPSVAKHKIKPVSSDVRIFPQGKPLPAEVKQADVGDCFLMAVLVSLAKKRPQDIINCFPQGLDEIEKRNDVIVRFYDYDDDDNLISRHIVVDKRKVIAPDQIRGGALWPKLIEKAYIKYIGLFGDPNDKLLDGGYIDEMWELITGKPTKVVSNYKYAFFRRKKEAYDRIIPKIISKLKAGRAITCHFVDNFETKDAKSEECIEVFKGHAYAIVGINEEKEYIRLIDPNKVLGRQVKNSPKSKEGGHIAISFKDFVEHFSQIAYSKQ